jgi:hypothetical protein
MKSAIDNAPEEKRDGTVILPGIAIDLGAIGKVSIPVSRVRKKEFARDLRGKR